MNTEWKPIPASLYDLILTGDLEALLWKLKGVREAEEVRMALYNARKAILDAEEHSDCTPAPTSHPIPTGATGERDWELACDECNGSGHVFVKHQVAERKTDVQEFKEECEACEGRGFNIAFEDIPGIAEYVKSCRPAATVATEGGRDERQEFETWAKKKKMPLARIGQQYDDFWVDHAWNGWQARASISAPAAGDALDLVSLLNIRFTPVSEGLPDLVEYSPSYAGQWSSKWCAVITARGNIEASQLVLPSSEKEALEAARFNGAWRSGMDPSRVVAWAYMDHIRSAAEAAAIAQQSQRKEA